MITATQIRNGGNHFFRHLSANDYYSEGETVVGYWLGEGAKMLGLEGDVLSEQFRALCDNRHPTTGEKLRPRRARVELHDFALSAPKGFSIAARVGGDERLLLAYREATETTLKELEKLAEVRVRHGQYYGTEQTRRTGNVVAAVYQHDASRLLDPQCHAHLVMANMSFDHDRNSWFALQPRAMLEATWITGEFRQELARLTEELGYQVEWRGKHFGIVGISKELEDKFSERTLQRRAFEKRYLDLFGKEPSKRRIEEFIKDGKRGATRRFRDEFREHFGRNASATQVDAFVRDWRSSKLIKISTTEVRKKQRAKLSTSERASLDTVVREARRVAAQNNVASVVQNPVVDQRWVALKNLTREWLATAGAKSEETLMSLGKAVREMETRRSRESAKPTEKVAAKQPREVNVRRRAAVSRTEILRRMRFGMQVQAACKGYHSSLVARSLRRSVRR